MTGQKDYYHVLAVDKEAPAEKIKEAYRKLAFEYHPDRNRENPSAVEKMKEINEAYAVLSDPKKRRDYDTFYHQYGPNGYTRFKQRYSEQDIFRGSDINQIFEEMARAFGFRGFEEVFRESYGQGYHTFEFHRPGASGRGFVFFGPGFRRRHDSIPKNEGQSIPGSPDLLPGALGKMVRYLLKKTLNIAEPKRGKDLEDIIYLNPQQAFDGGKGKYFHRKRSKELIVNIPPGMKEGKKIRLKGMGEPGKDSGQPGDLYLRVKVKKPLLQRMKELFS